MGGFFLFINFGITVKKDEIFDYPQEVLDFSFDERTAAVFPDMVHRSIPGYAAVLQMTAAIADYFLRRANAEKPLIYDLGCSLGAVSLALKRVIPENCQIIAVDNSSAMTSRLSEYVAGAGIQNIQVKTEDILTIQLDNCDVLIMNFLMQFLEPKERTRVLKNIYESIKNNGILLLAEKTSYEDDISRLFHENFKRHQGYSDLAIAQKRESLEQVMLTDNREVIEQRLKEVGFKQVIPYFQAFSFRAWVAVK